jgi:hypothetical protein
MGYQGGFVTEEGDPHPTSDLKLCKTAANNQYALGWTSPTRETESNGPLGLSNLRRTAPGISAPDSTFLNVTRSGTYRISAHVGPASENAHPELLVLPSQEEYKFWFISFEEGDVFDLALNLHLRIYDQMRKVTVRYQYQFPDGLEDSMREALLGVGECVELEDTIGVCNEALYGSEEADVSVKFPGWRTRRTFGRRVAQGP